MKFVKLLFLTGCMISAPLLCKRVKVFRPELNKLQQEITVPFSDVQFDKQVAHQINDIFIQEVISCLKNDELLRQKADAEFKVLLQQEYLINLKQRYVVDVKQAGQEISQATKELLNFFIYAMEHIRRIDVPALAGKYDLNRDQIKEFESMKDWCCILCFVRSLGVDLESGTIAF